jgi:hypothetical protein
MKYFWIIVGLFAVGLAGSYAVKHMNKQNVKVQNATTTVKVSPEADKVFSQMAKWLPNATFGLPKKTTEQTGEGDFTGESLSGFTMSDTASMDHFEDEAYMESLGYTPDNNLAADGPGSSVWGYSKEENGKKQIATFSYETKPDDSDPNTPLQFNCPCNTNVKAFVSE